ncbi:hypothetical protein DM01DRAFT_1339940 [Hesseltinella vesiculosa]|uniref:Uncharacterized protein n=1 Tax=Hesseltinella vesiculosa TaxID=101127 RepID=A0A1X2G5Q6_9FUNG|nr:hypothetical protein DM01DRAFT_1339940 [Hesseltinella vesiculosa]
MNPTVDYQHDYMLDYQHEEYQPEHLKEMDVCFLSLSDQELAMNDAMYLANYDQTMEMEAEYFDQCVEDQHHMVPPEQEYRADNDDTYHYENDALLKLIVGVQSYLTDAACDGMDRQDSPLLDLQYKMYMYLKQRASDMGVDLHALDQPL